MLTEADRRLTLRQTLFLSPMVCSSKLQMQTCLEEVVAVTICLGDNITSTTDVVIANLFPL